MSVYSFNTSLGLYEYPDEHALEDYEADPDYENPIVPDYTAEIAEDVVVPDPSDQSYSSWLVAEEQEGVVPGPLLAPVRYLGEYNSGEVVVNDVGYIPLVRRVEDLMRAGLNLQDYRDSVYDGHDIGDDTIPVDPMRRQNMDLTDFDALQKKAAAALKTVQDAVTLKGRQDVPSDALQAPSDASGASSEEVSDASSK